MLPDASLRAIASNLARLNLDPLLHLKIAVAVVGPLIGAVQRNIPAVRTLAKAAVHFGWSRPTSSL